MIIKSYLAEQNHTGLDKKLLLFYGENLGLRNDFKRILKIKNHDSEILIFNQEDILKDDNLFYNEISNISLFEKEKVFFINQVNDKILNIIIELEAKENTHKFYFFSEILDKKSKVRNYFEKSQIYNAIPCYSDNELNLKKIILNRLEGFKGLTTYNINLIIENCNLNRDTLNNELNKILSYFEDKNLITEKLEKLLDLRINDNFNNLKDQALSGSKTNTNKLLSDTIIDTEKNIYYLALINLRLNKLSEAIKNSKKTNLEDAINKLKPPIFWKDKPAFMFQVKRWNNSKIKLILVKTYNLEIEIKSNALVNKNILMKKLLVDICNLANAS